MRRTFALVAVLAMIGLHQDFWLWGDTTLVLGFLPSGLAYHAAYSLATAVLWALIARYAWPAGLDESEQPAGDREERAP
ncbi:MAG: DUF3311 domain-containing protein [Bryobacterales bacterium]|nr:DUF3311 domain-containing protein [Bryobacterales bacterium]